MSVVRDVFRPTVTNSGELWRYVASVSLLASFAALTVDVVNNLVFFESWMKCLRSWSITTTLAVSISIPIARSIGKAHMALFYAKQEADRLGRTDPLTGLANRRAFYEATAQFSGCIIVLVIADIDRFKRINDRYGHAAGDEALKTIARIMQNELGSLGTLARVGGEEFAFACVNHSRVEVREHLRKLQQFLAAAPIVFAGGSVYATISAGIAAKADASFDDLYAAADRALYIAKASGRDRVVDADEIDAIDSEPIASKSNLPRAS